MSLKLEWIDERESGIEAGEAGWQELLANLLELAGQSEGVADGLVSLTLTDNEGIRELNRQYRGLDKPTDVLSFPLREAGEASSIVYDGEYETETVEIQGDWGEEDDDGDTADPTGGEPFEELLGDIVISIPRMREQAEEYGHSQERELGFLFVHGFLHLLGYDHEDEAAEKTMFAKQEAVLAKAGLAR
ncbi:rRNA maturation RNase YbeY [Cohnella nanjingensis]|uniref:Endoribonuclease YbeY n=1 Tax=Cohnella nanjingensis TaxID=1387779 RepID=A0A7X0VJ86_9BACL|nr:rRNA maturation RNase YbeY [Cohnella nanjingensis]MBB6675308.1 rRNA maturation RNase YbeY [Cohnella nanjingensis]